MPPQENRDTTVLNHLLDIKTELAKNTTVTESLRDHVHTLNGKVAGHETRLQSLESDKAYSRGKGESVERETSYSRDLFRRWTDRIAWGIFVIFLMLFYALLTRSGLVADFLN